MPHYADGTEAKVGDQVYGKLYNTEGPRAGTLISITPGVDSCNALVQFAEAVPVETAADGSKGAKSPRMAVVDPRDGTRHLSRPMRGQNHGSVGDEFMVFVCADYSAVSDLTKIGP